MLKYFQQRVDRGLFSRKLRGFFEKVLAPAGLTRSLSMWAPRGNTEVDRGSEPAVDRLTWESGPSPPLCRGPKGYELTRSNLDR